jgi:hypothetical protein
MNDMGALQVRHESKQVLEENDYLAALGAIIERDFFPQTQGLRDQLTALETQEDLNSGEPVRIALAFARIRGAKQVEGGGGQYSRLSLDEFLQSYTSEDNASFEALQLKDQAERRRSHHWVYEPGEAESYAARAIRLDPTLRIEPAKGPSKQGQKPGMLSLYYTAGQELSAEDRRALDARCVGLRMRGDDRPAAPEGANFRVRNHFMFAPDSDSTHSASAPALAGMGLLCDAPGRPGTANARRAPKELLRHNTAFPPSFSHDVEGDESMGLEAPHTPSVYSEQLGESKRYQTVPMSPAPGRNVIPPLTYGVLFAPPLLLDEPNLRLAPAAAAWEQHGLLLDAPSREALAHNLDQARQERERRARRAERKERERLQRRAERKHSGPARLPAAARALALRMGSVGADTALLRESYAGLGKSKGKDRDKGL